MACDAPTVLGVEDDIEHVEEDLLSCEMFSQFSRRIRYYKQANEYGSRKFANKCIKS